jgi:flavoprotein
MRKLVALPLLLAGAMSAFAQVPPYVYPVTLGTSSVQILPVNPERKRLFFHNPNATALVAVCPVGPARVTGGVAVVAAINGAGCRTILPLDAFTVDGSSGGSGPPLYMPSAWLGIASAASSGLTVLEFE